MWLLTHRNDVDAARIADAHYNRQNVGATRYIPPGRTVPLITRNCDALWVTLWQYPQFVDHQWKEAWVCSTFRRESTCTWKASDMIRRAIAVTRGYWWQHDPLKELSDGYITFINPNKVPAKSDGHGKSFWGYCFIRAGFRQIGVTDKGLIVMGLRRNKWPDPLKPDLDDTWKYTKAKEPLIDGHWKRK